MPFQFWPDYSTTCYSTNIPWNQPIVFKESNEYGHERRSLSFHRLRHLEGSIAWQAKELGNKERKAQSQIKRRQNCQARPQFQTLLTSRQWVLAAASRH